MRDGFLRLADEGTLVGTGTTTIEADGKLRVHRAAGNDAALHSVDTLSVVLDGGIFSLGVDSNPTDFLNNTSTGGVLSFDAHNTNNINLSTVLFGNGVRLAADANRTLSGVISANSAAVLKLGGDENHTLTLTSDVLTANNISAIQLGQGGSATISGRTDVSGTTTVAGGTLAFTNVDNTLSGAFQVSADATLSLSSSTGGVDTQLEQIEYSQAVSGGGNLYVSGSLSQISGGEISKRERRMIVSGANTFLGDFTLGSGIVVVEGNVPGGGGVSANAMGLGDNTVRIDTDSALLASVADGASSATFQREVSANSSRRRTRIGAAYNPNGGANQTIFWDTDYVWREGGGARLRYVTAGGLALMDASVWNGFLVEQGTTFILEGGTVAPTGAFNPLYDGVKLDNLNTGSNYYSVSLGGGGTMVIDQNFDRLAYQDTDNGVGLGFISVLDATTLVSMTTGEHFLGINLRGSTFKVNTEDQVFKEDIWLSPGLFDDTLAQSNIVTDGVDLTVSGKLTIGTGTTLLHSGTGSVHFTGGVNVQAGGLLTSTGVGISVSADSGASVMGSGTIASGVTIGDNGTLAPGNSTGTLTITGDVAFEENAFFEVELADADDHDLASITGTASLDGTLTIQLLDGYDPGYGDSFTVMTATGLITGGFDAVSGDLARGGNAPFVVEVSDHEVVVSVARQGDADADGSVGLSDLIALAGAWRSTVASWSSADFNDDGTVDPLDLALIQLNWDGDGSNGPTFAQALSSVSFVPEPTSLLLLGMSGVLLLTTRGVTAGRSAAG